MPRSETITMPLSEARSKLSRLVDEVAEGGRPVVITQRNRQRAVLVSFSWYQAALQRLTKGAKPRLARLRGIAEVPRGLDVDQALEELNLSIRNHLEKKSQEI